MNKIWDQAIAAVSVAFSGGTGRGGAVHWLGRNLRNAKTRTALPYFWLNWFPPLPFLASFALGGALVLPPAFPPLCDPYYGVTYFFSMCGASLVCEISPGRRPLQRHKVSTRKRNRRPQSKFAEMMAPTTGILCGRQCSKVALVVCTRDPLYSSANNNQGLKGCHVQRRKTAPLPKKGNLFWESSPPCILILV